MRHTAFSFRLNPNASTQVVLARHVGAARFAFNTGVHILKQALAAQKVHPKHKVPRSGFDFINAFNAWKISDAAGHDENGTPGLPWRREVCAQVFEEACIDLGRATDAWGKAAKAKGKGRRVGMPRFKKKGRSQDHFRMRNKKNDVRIGTDSIRLPKIGEIPVWESTRRLRRLLRDRPDGTRARICFVTITRVCGHWFARVNVEASDLVPSSVAKAHREPVGIDLGLSCFAVAAVSTGEEVWRSAAPKPLHGALRRLRRKSRALSRRKKGSSGREHARRQVARLHHRVANIRRSYLHALSKRIAQTHGHVVLEDLHIAGMIKNRCLARQIADSAWGIFVRQLRYKGSWHGCVVSGVDRFAPTSRTCCRCDWKATELPLSQRVFVCDACSWTADRDTNAAANCARWLDNSHKAASKQGEAQNA